MATQELKPSELMIGNFFDSMGHVEMVQEIRRTGEKEWYIGHSAWGKDVNPVPDGIGYSGMPIPLTKEWKECLGIDKFEGLPERIRYVHQAQNYFTCVLEISLLEQLNWDKLPKI